MAVAFAASTLKYQDVSYFVLARNFFGDKS